MLCSSAEKSILSVVVVVGGGVVVIGLVQSTHYVSVAHPIRCVSPQTAVNGFGTEICSQPRKIVASTSATAALHLH